VESREYMDRLFRAAESNYQNLIPAGCIYHGKEGHLRFAREFGYGLAEDSDEVRRRDTIQSSYSRYVKLCGLKPLLDAKDWVSAILAGISRDMER